MPINYPGSPDVFTVPSEPENTPLSEAGTGSRNHTESIHDQGLAIVALETNAAKKAHDHSGDATDVTKGAKLAAANTHQSPDTDAAPGSAHHTLGPSGNQAAPGNHGHTYASLPDRPYIICTSTTRPVSPLVGMQIIETDTGFQRIWLQLTGESAPAWHLVPVRVPACRLRQSSNQTIAAGTWSGSSGTILQWQGELEDNNNFFNAAVSQTDIVIHDAGLYHVDCAVQWDPSVVPDVGFIWLTINGQDTTFRKHALMRGGHLFTPPGYSQTLDLSGKIRFVAGDILRVRASYVQPGGIFGIILSWFDGPTKVDSRIELCYLAP